MFTAGRYINIKEGRCICRLPTPIGNIHLSSLGYPLLNSRDICAQLCYSSMTYLNCVVLTVCSLSLSAAYVSIQQHTSAYVSTRQHTSAHVSIRQHTLAYCSSDCLLLVAFGLVQFFRLFRLYWSRYWF
jgi:hypothetical protein